MFRMTILTRLAAVAALVVSAPAVAGDLKLWYTRPAAKWEEALPIGSGRLGAMVFGGTSEDRLQFNEDTLWTGAPHDYVRAGARQSLEKIRALVFEGKAKEAGDLVRKSFLSDPVRQKAYQPLADLRFTFPGHESASDYRRELDLESAVARVSYHVGEVTYTREAFASYPDNVIVVRISSSVPGKLAFGVRLNCPHKDSAVTSLGGDVLVLSGRVRDLIPPNEPGMKFESRLHVVAEGGTVAASGDAINVTNADAATLLLVAATSYVNYADISGDPAARCEGYLKAVREKTFDALRRAHESDYRRLFGRAALELGRGERAGLPTDERLKSVRAAANPTASTAKSAPVPSTLPAGGLAADPGLAALFFQYGRYLLIASSRPGGQPANLQGVWNELLNPPWESKYTTNINLEMNYWPAEVGNLAECADPLFAMIDDLRVTGARTAREQYGARGWVLHHNTDHWRGTAPINNVDGVWPTGGAWLCYHLWEHYLFTGDREFLEKRAYPAMKEASLFFVDTLAKDPGTGFLVTNPSYSPEQGELCAGPAMDMQLIRALFDSTAEAAGVLGTDGEFVKELREVRSKLAPDRIGRHGQLQEWQEDVDKPGNNHRHMSPLWGLYPGAQFTPADPKPFEAAKVLLGWRGDGSTGWSYAWRIPLHARVGDGDMAYRQLSLQLGKRTLPNLLDLCGPFQIDGNFGATAGIAEMLLQSHVRPTEDRGQFQIDLLPALPAAWGTGMVEGLRARGGFEVSMKWDGSKLTRVELTSRLGRPCVLRYARKSVELPTRSGQVYAFDGDLNPVPAAATKTPIVIDATEQSRVNPALPDGGIPPAVGVQSFQVFRATRDLSDQADGKGWTYNHHVDMARWKGRLYVGWDSCERDEDVWPSRELYSSSPDGVTWSAPTELFPQGVSTALRMYFYRAANARMLAIAGLRVGTGEVSEDRKVGIVVREIRPDHSMGEVYTLQDAPGAERSPASYETSNDQGFVEACRRLLADRVYLEQQDYGRLLGGRRMKWHDPSAWPGGAVPGTSDKWVAGKAYSFFKRPDGVVIGISKMGWTTSTADNGESWSRPSVPPTLVTGNAKVWGQRTADGRYALAYNPSKGNRFPLVVVSGEDGEHFGRMRVVQGEIPVQRYSGLHRSLGPQYVRGISTYADDGTGAKDAAMWVAYSMSKEDIWVSRIPLPIAAGAGDSAEDLTRLPVGGMVPGWNTYRPKWTDVSVVESPDGAGTCLRLEDRDPYDYARAVRAFPPAKEVSLTVEACARSRAGAPLEIELLPTWGGERPVRIALESGGAVTAANGGTPAELGRYKEGEWLAFRVTADAVAKRFSVELNGRPVLSGAALAEGVDDFQRVSFRTGTYRGIGGAGPVAPGSDRPVKPAEYFIRNVHVSEKREVSQ